MAAELGDLYARLKLDTSSLDAAQAKMRGIGGSLAGGLAIAGAAAVATGVSVAAVAVKMAGDFQQLTTQIVSGAGESTKNLELIRQGVLALAPAVGSSPAELAKALYLIESAGFHGAAGLAVLKVTAEGARVGMANQTTVANAVTSALNAYALSSDKAVNVTNDLIATEAAGKLHMEDLAAAIGAVLAPAAALGVKLPEVSAAIATMTVQGTDASRATQSLRFLLASLTGPTAAAAGEFKGLGIGLSEIPGITGSVTAEMKKLGLKSSEVAYTLTHKGLQAALTQVTDAIGKQFPVGSAAYNAALRDAVGGTRGFTAALELTGTHAAVFTKNVSDIAAAAAKGGSAVHDWDLIQQNFNTRMAQAKAAVEVFLIHLGTRLLPMLDGVVSAFTTKVLPALQRFSDWFLATALPALVSFGTWMYTNVITPLVHVASVVIPPVLTALGWLLGKLNGLKGILLPLGTAFAALWAVDKIAGWASAATTAIARVVASFGTGGAASSLSKLFPNLFGGAAATAGAGGVADAVKGMRVWGGPVEVIGLGTGPGGKVPVGAVPTPTGGIPPAVKAPFGTTGLLGLVTAAATAAALAYTPPIESFAAPVKSAQTAFQNLADSVKHKTDQYNTSLVAVALALRDMGLSTSQGASLLQALPKLYEQHIITSGADLAAAAAYLKDYEQKSGGLPPSMQQLRDAIETARAQATHHLNGANLNLELLGKAVNDLSALAQDTGSQAQLDLTALEHHLSDAGLGAVVAGNAVKALGDWIAVHGPLTEVQMAAFEIAVTGGAKSAQDIQLALATLSIDVAQYERDIQRALAPSIGSGAVRPGYRGGQHGAVVNAPASGEPWILHGVEAIVPKSLAPPWLWDAVLGALSGRDLTVRPGLTLQAPTAPSLGAHAPAPAAAAMPLIPAGHTFNLSIAGGHLSPTQVAQEIAWMLKSPL